MYVIVMTRAIAFSTWIFVSGLLYSSQQQQGVLSAFDWAQFGAIGVLAAVMLYLYSQQNKQHREDLKNIYERHEKKIESLNADALKEREGHRGEFKELSERMLTVAESSSSATQSLSTAINDIHKQIDTAASIRELEEKLRSEIRRPLRGQ